MPLTPLLDLLSLDELRTAVDRRETEAAIRARCIIAPVDATTLLCRILGRYKFYVDSRDQGFAPHLLLDGYWEYWITEYMWKTVSPGEVAYDLGANHGYYSVLLADLVGASGRLRAFEPNPRLHQLVTRNLAVSGFAEISQVHAVAVGDSSLGTAMLRAAVTDPKNGHVVFGAGDGGPLPEELTQSSVPTMCLDDLAGEKVDFIKIDVEGAEEQVWAGMQGVLDTNPRVRILLEFNARRCTAPATLLQQIARRFPLVELDQQSVLHKVSAEELMRRDIDTMLMLTAA